MAAADTTTLTVQRREPGSSRATRRLRREGWIPGVVYGGGDDPVTFQVEARTLRHALAHGGAVIELSVDGETGTPVVLKEEQRDPIGGGTIHIDLLRVRLDRAIQATTILELTGGEESPGVKEGGILEQITRELNIEALPTAIPDAILHDVAGMEMNDTLTLAAITAPEGVTLLDDLEETVVATLSPPRIEEEPEEELEAETELVGEGEEGEAPAEGEGEAPAEGDAGGDAPAEESGDS
ncbi:MAG: large subunit ribosomal protein [Solirubrobacteraceae bacterium]|nr:large subunit ribosomal protein [Solirubrobacteraceae bacterium]